MTPGYEEAKRCAEKAILDAEKYKATIAEPPEPGNEIIIPHFDVRSSISDDDFFHLVCHIDSSMVSKIEKGEFIELKKLLPKDRKRKSDDNHLEWVHQDGGTFLALVSDRMNKISSVRKWEQAFRVYATIYCGANPGRAKEIWEYVSVINTAASSFMWDNVYEYDVTFRHLMAFNPNRSWAVTYNQMWNICMCDPLPSQNMFQGCSANYSGNRQSNSNTGTHGSGNKKKKSDYCWNFNKGQNCKYRKKCRFIEHCSYCDSESHGLNKCPKLEKDKQGDDK